MATNQYGFSRMLKPENLFRFVCPVFNAEVEARVCFKLHESFMRGQPHAKRPGCNACMAANKCPVPHMTNEVLRNRAEAYFAAEPTVGNLSKDVIERVAPVIVMEKTLRKYGASPAEEAAIEAATFVVGEKPAGTKKRGAVVTVKLDKSDDEAPDATIEAAKTGDLGAALTKAAAAPKPKPAPKAADPILMKKPAATPTGKPGMSLLELARQKKAS